jgi:hypothetical protein
MQNNIIFYSQRCNESVCLLKLLKNENFINYFKLICVDGNLNKLPPQITSVPTMIVTGINKPLLAKESFEWVNKMKFLKQYNNNKNNINNNNNNNNINMQEYQGFMSNEMSGLSDSYAFLNFDNAMQQSYSDATGQNSAIFTAPEKDKITRYDQKKMLDEATETRKQQEKTYSGLMKEAQINMLMLKDQENS